MSRFTHHRNPCRRRGLTIVWTVVSLTTMAGFAALAVDVGFMYSVQAELQRSADATALAAAGRLATGATILESKDNALLAAQLTGVGNHSDQRPALVNAADVVFGTSTVDSATGKYVFVDDDSGDVSAARVTVYSPNTGLIFSRLLGFTSTDLSAKATAVLLPRDIAIVIDLSGSMRYDSMMRFRDSRSVNTRDIWASLDGPEPSRPYVPGPETQTEYAGDSGPALGIMTQWGDHLDSGTYDPATDPGLWYFPLGQATTNLTVVASLQGRGYSPGDIATITSATSNTTEWRGRTAVMVGLAEWNNSGGSDTSVNELTWAPYPSFRVSWTWSQYLDWIRGSGLSSAYNGFQYRLGPKTYTEFLLDRNKLPSKNNFSLTPQQPLRAVKDAVQTLVDTVGQLDHVSLETFNQTGYHEVDLSGNHQAAADRLYGLQTNHNDQSSTNIADGLQRAIDELNSPRARSTARKVIVLMSDGAVTAGPNPVTVAQVAADQNIKIYTVSVGFGADRNLMQQIAAIGSGQEFYAAGAPDTYTAQLQQIFRTIGGLRQAVLID